MTRGWLATVATVPFHDTVNRDQNPASVVWVTAEFFATSKEGMIGCAGYIETGVIDLVFMGTSGIGDTEVLAAAEGTIAAFMAMEDAAHKLTLVDYEPVREVSGGDADRWYRLGIGVTYSFSG
jgi:hypothetical protein